MGGHGTFKERDILAALEQCLSGFTVRDFEHHYSIRLSSSGLTGKLPHPKHGKREGSGEIQGGHIRKLARLFRIEHCMGTKLPGLFGSGKCPPPPEDAT